MRLLTGDGVWLISSTCPSPGTSWGGNAAGPGRRDGPDAIDAAHDLVGFKHSSGRPDAADFDDDDREALTSREAGQVYVMRRHACKQLRRLPTRLAC